MSEENRAISLKVPVLIQKNTHVKNLLTKILCPANYLSKMRVKYIIFKSTGSETIHHYQMGTKRNFKRSTWSWRKYRCAQKNTIKEIKNTENGQYVEKGNGLFI